MKRFELQRVVGEQVEAFAYFDTPTLALDRRDAANARTTLGTYRVVDLFEFEGERRGRVVERPAPPDRQPPGRARPHRYRTRPQKPPERGN